MHQELHWLDIPERVNYKLRVLTHRCLLGKAPMFLSNCCIPVSQVATRRNLRCAARHQLTVTRHRLSTYGRRAFAVAGPTMFSTLPDDLRDSAVKHIHGPPSDNRWRHIFSLPIRTFSALKVSHVMRSINVRYIFLLTYNTRHAILPISTTRWHTISLQIYDKISHLRVGILSYHE